jgi:site-specific DNA-methyltransferase (cytosine-N4-specific)
MYNATIEGFLSSYRAERLAGQVQLVFTSPPFPLRRKKKYGNKEGQEYVDWLAALAQPLSQLLTPTGSVVIEIGNAWNPGEPTMSVLGIKALLAFLEVGQLHLCQQFICDNPTRLPGPTEWVNRRRIRVKDSFTHVWWMSPTATPSASNRAVLKPYSASMKRLLETGKYNAGLRPSEHRIGETSFLTANGGAIPSNVLSISNTGSSDSYLTYCKELGLGRHPARMQPGLAEFFIRFLTKEGDLVFDPFAGSNTTGSVAEALGRRWVGVEAQEDYALASKGRFAKFQKVLSASAKSERRK